MGLFKPYDDADKAPEPAEQTDTATGSKSGAKKKAIPTPTRRQAEQARRERLHPTLTPKETRAQERMARYKDRDEQMARIDAQPRNVFIRDWVDRRWSVTEFMLPLMVIFFVATIGGTYLMPDLMYYSTFLIWALFGLLIMDIAVMWFGCRRRLREFFPSDPMKGTFSYAMRRLMMMRRARMPQPRVKRGSPFVWPNPADLR